MINTQTYIQAVLKRSKPDSTKKSSSQLHHQETPQLTPPQSPAIESNAIEKKGPPCPTTPSCQHHPNNPKPPTEPNIRRSPFKSIAKPKKKDKSKHKMDIITKGKSAQQMQMQSDEAPMEASLRESANFPSIESQLDVKRFSLQDAFQLDKLTGKLLGQHNPFSKKATPDENIVWLFDNTAYRPIHPYPHDIQPWQAEFVASFFKKGRIETGKFVANIADLIGIDGQVGEGNAATRKIIEERSEPFIHAISAARIVDVTLPIPEQGGGVDSHTLSLGPSDDNGISSQVFAIGGDDTLDGKSITVTSVGDAFPLCKARMRFAGPEGWGIISDIDDTIKVTQTVDPLGILKTTFADEPKTTSGMPEFYKILNEQFENPAWFYLSASPYNLYPFLHQFINDKYLPGTIILRDSSWMYLGGLLQSLTQGVKPYKVDRMNKINSWLPKRKMICVGDSTQMDPESYAEIYKKYPGWIHAIYIRKVTDAPHMEEKNKEERFTKAFEGVEPHIWKVFQEPDELAEHVKHLAGTAHLGLTGALQGYFCKHEQATKKA